MKYASRKERAHKLIQIGTIFETLGLMEEDYESLLGFNSKFLKLDDKQKELYKTLGQEILKLINLERKKNGN